MYEARKVIIRNTLLQLSHKGAKDDPVWAFMTGGTVDYEGLPYKVVGMNPYDDGERVEFLLNPIELRCAKCGKIIGSGEDYLEVCDNQLQVKYFDQRKDAFFCGDECLKKALTVERRTWDGRLP